MITGAVAAAPRPARARKSPATAGASRCGIASIGLWMWSVATIAIQTAYFKLVASDSGEAQRFMCE